MSALKDQVGKVIKNSELVAAVAPLKKTGVKSVLFGNKVRALKPQEIDALEANGNYCPDWNKRSQLELLCSRLYPGVEKRKNPL